MTEAQHASYFKLWASACKAQGWNKLPTAAREAKRREVHVQVFGAPKSAKDINHTNDFGAIKAKFEFLAGQLRGAMEDGEREPDEKRRLLWVMRRRLFPQLALYVMDNPERYVESILKERFKLFKGISSPDDLSAKSRIGADGKPKPSPLLMLVMTFSARIDAMRRASGDSVHAMNHRAKTPCKRGCAECAAIAASAADVDVEESDLAGETESVTTILETGDPF